MTLNEILDIARNLVDETDVDDQIDIILKSAINEAYRNLCSVDKRVTTAFLPIVNGIATLPDNYITMVDVTPKLGVKDKVVGNAIVTENTGVFNLIYSYSREELIAGNDEPDLHPMLHPALYNYAAYKYWMHRKKGGVPDYFLQTYNNIVGSFTMYSLNESQEEYVQDWR